MDKEQEDKYLALILAQQQRIEEQQKTIKKLPTLPTFVWDISMVDQKHFRIDCFSHRDCKEEHLLFSKVHPFGKRGWESLRLHLRVHRDHYGELELQLVYTGIIVDDMAQKAYTTAYMTRWRMLTIYAFVSSLRDYLIEEKERLSEMNIAVEWSLQSCPI